MKQRKPKSEPFVFPSDEPQPWETTPFMIKQEEQHRNRAYFDYKYNPDSGKVERVF